MDVNVLLQWASAGMTPEETAVLAKAFGRDDVKSRVLALKAQDEYAAIEAERLRLQQELEGDGTKLGAKAYQKWVGDNQAAIEALKTREAAYRAKFGDLEAGGAPPSPAGGKVMTEDDIKREVDKRFQESIAPNLARTFTTANKLIQTHILAGRKTMLDLDALGQTANTKFGGDLERAYEEWDRPEKERLTKEATDAEINRRVNEEIAKRGAHSSFPPTETGPSTLIARTKADVDKFDRVALANDLVGTWNNAGTGRTQ